MLNPKQVSSPYTHWKTMPEMDGSNPDSPTRCASVLSHIGDPSPVSDHSVFWKAWYSRFVARSPVLRERTDADQSDPSATHEFHGDEGVRIGCSLVMPEGQRVKGAVVFVHGAGDPGALAIQTRRWRKLGRAGLAVLTLRLRGFGGSRLDIADNDIGWDARGESWVTRGLLDEKHESWVLPHMVSDVCDAVRVLRGAMDNGWIGDVAPGAPIMLAGRSLGGGLATIAAAQLNGRQSGANAVSRLVLWQPSLGAVPWRVTCAPSGVYASIRDMIESEGHDGDPDRDPNENNGQRILDRVRLCDAVVHARRVRIPVLAQLALRDEVVPPQAGASVFNAIHSDPGRKWRQCIDEGHADLTRTTARSELLFRRMMVDFFDPDRRPIDSMARWESELASC